MNDYRLFPQAADVNGQRKSSGQANEVLVSARTAKPEKLFPVFGFIESPVSQEPSQTILQRAPFVLVILTG